MEYRGMEMGLSWSSLLAHRYFSLT